MRELTGHNTKCRVGIRHIVAAPRSASQISTRIMHRKYPQAEGGSPTSGELPATTTCTRRRSMYRVFSSLDACKSKLVVQLSESAH